METIKRVELFNKVISVIDEFGHGITIADKKKVGMDCYHYYLKKYKIEQDEQNVE